MDRFWYEVVTSWYGTAFPVLGIDDLARLRGELEDVAGRWKDIGLNLGIRNHNLEAIETEVSVSMDRLTKMLTMWLKWNYNYTKNGKPSWRKLVEVVAQSSGGGNPSRAMKIAKKYEGIRTIMKLERVRPNFSLVLLS